MIMALLSSYEKAALPIQSIWKRDVFTLGYTDKKHDRVFSDAAVPRR